MIVPGSGLVKEQAEAEGLDKIFKAAASNGASRLLDVPRDESRQARAGERCASTSNRNFEGRRASRAARIWCRRRWRRPRRSPGNSSTCATGTERIAQRTKGPPHGGPFRLSSAR
jgi:hypothetical protein